METRANYVAVGAFTLAAVFITFVLVYWFGRYGDGDNLVPLDVRVEGSVSGLGPGSVVQFNGITVGRVEDISFDTSDPRFVIVHTVVDRNTPVREDTRATVGLRGLSGGAFIALEGGSANGQNLLRSAEDAPDNFTPRIQGDPSAISDLIDRVNQISTQVERTMGTLESFVDENSGNLTRTFQNVEAFTAALSANSDGVAKFMNSAGEAAVALEGLAGKIDGTVTQVEAITKAVDPVRVGKAVDGLSEFAEGLGESRENYARIIASATDAAADLGNVTRSISTTVDGVQAVVAAIDPARVTSTLSNIDTAAEGLSKTLAAVDGAKVGAVVDDLAAATASVRGLTEGIDAVALGSLVSELSQAGGRVNEIVGSVTPAQVSALLNTLQETSTQAQAAISAFDSTKLDGLVSDAAASVAGVRGLVDAIDRTAVQQLVSDVSTATRNVSTLLSAVDAQRLNGALDSVTETAEGAQKIVEDVRAVTSKFADRGPDVDRIIDDAVALSARVNETSKSLDSAVAKISALLGDGTADALVGDVRSTLASFRETARTLSQRVSEVSASVTGFTKRGLGDTQGLINDARQSIGRIDRVIRNLEANPSALISGSGGSRVRETDTARPRR